MGEELCPWGYLCSCILTFDVCIEVAVARLENFIAYGVHPDKISICLFYSWGYVPTPSPWTNP